MVKKSPNNETTGQAGCAWPGCTRPSQLSSALCVTCLPVILNIMNAYLQSQETQGLVNLPAIHAAVEQVLS